MRNLTFNDALVIQPKTRNTTKEDWTRYETPILIAVGGGLLFAILGFFLLAVYAVFERNNAALNYAGSGALIIAFIFFGFCAHFMDKSDKSKRQFERAQWNNLTENNSEERSRFNNARKIKSKKNS
jgi:cytochrome c biogenesis protein CcdA